MKFAVRKLAFVIDHIGDEHADTMRNSVDFRTLVVTLDDALRRDYSIRDRHGAILKVKDSGGIERDHQIEISAEGASCHLPLSV